MKNDISPEEKLLRLIRGKRQDIPIDKKSLPTVTESKPVVRASVIQKYLSFFTIRTIILVGFMASFIYLIISFIYSWVGLEKIKLPKVTEEKITEPKIEPKQEIKPYEFYLQGIRQHQIFSGISQQEIERPVSNLELIKDINLIGIISGENPQAIIEDKKTEKTYYLNKGQFIRELEVEDIKEGKIILNYKGQRFELFL